MNLFWVSPNNEPELLTDDDEFYNMWNNVEVNDDGYLHLYMSISDKILLKGDLFASSSGVTNPVIYSTPIKVMSFSSDDEDGIPGMVNGNSHRRFLTLTKHVSKYPLKFVSKSPGMGKNPRLVAKSIAAQTKGLGSSMRKLFMHMNDNVEDGIVVMSVRSNPVDIEYENIQLENVNEDECHHVGDDKSLVCSDDEEVELELGQVRHLVNSYFDDDFWKCFKGKEQNDAEELQQALYADAVQAGNVVEQGNDADAVQAGIIVQQGNEADVVQAGIVVPAV